MLASTTLVVALFGLWIARCKPEVRKESIVPSTSFRPLSPARLRVSDTSVAVDRLGVDVMAVSEGADSEKWKEVQRSVRLQIPFSHRIDYSHLIVSRY